MALIFQPVEDAHRCGFFPAGCQEAAAWAIDGEGGKCGWVGARGLRGLASSAPRTKRGNLANDTVKLALGQKHARV
jgi:hypothetical protein